MAEMVALNDLKIFSNNDFNLSYFKYKDEYFFKAIDVAGGLKYKDQDKAVRMHVKEKYKFRFGKDFAPTNWPGENSSESRGGSNAIFISLPGLCQFLSQSNMPAADSFQDWVFEQVLPSIFKTGRYELEDLQQFCQIADGVTRESDNFKEIKKICIETNEKLKDDEKVKRGRKGGKKCWENINGMKSDLANTKASLRQTKLDLAMFQLKDKLVTKAVDEICANKKVRLGFKLPYFFRSTFRFFALPFGF